MRKIYVFGNEFFEGDEVPKKLSETIDSEKFDFILCESPNEILNVKEELIILDVVKGLKEVSVIDKINDLVLANSVTCHDLDLGFYLKLMKEVGSLTEVKIIGLPFGENNYALLKMKVEDILDEI